MQYSEYMHYRTHSHSPRSQVPGTGVVAVRGWGSWSGGEETDTSNIKRDILLWVKSKQEHLIQKHLLSVRVDTCIFYQKLQIQT